MTTLPLLPPINNAGMARELITKALLTPPQVHQFLELVVAAKAIRRKRGRGKRNGNTTKNSSIVRAVIRLLVARFLHLVNRGATMRCHYFVLVLVLTAGLYRNAFAEGCRSDELLVAEDDDYYYCMKRSVVRNCETKGGDVNKCVNAGCVRSAGEQLRAQINACKEENETCLNERGAPAALVASISGCIVGAAVGSLPGCFVGTAAGAVKWDSDVAVCRDRFGKCITPGLAQHKNYVSACSKYR